LAQDDYYYEIQLTNKQLVFYFMAGAAGLVLSFLAGVMVGRGVDTGAVAEAAHPVAEERVVAEQSPPASPAPSDYSYPQRLESDRPEQRLEQPHPAATAVASVPAAATPAPKPRPTPRASAAPPAPTPAPTAAATPLPTPPPPGTARLPRALPASASGFFVQVGAFKDRSSADSVVHGLKAKGMPAYVEAPGGGSAGLFTVRVGVYRDRVDAEAVAERLRADKFKPYIQKQ
jgi:cell division protein FtsN